MAFDINKKKEERAILASVAVRLHSALAQIEKAKEDSVLVQCLDTRRLHMLAVAHSREQSQIQQQINAYEAGLAEGLETEAIRVLVEAFKQQQPKTITIDIDQVLVDAKKKLFILDDFKDRAAKIMANMMRSYKDRFIAMRGAQHELKTLAEMQFNKGFTVHQVLLQDKLHALMLKGEHDKLIMWFEGPFVCSSYNDRAATSIIW